MDQFLIFYYGIGFLLAVVALLFFLLSSFFSFQRDRKCKTWILRSLFILFIVAFIVFMTFLRPAS